MQRSRWSLPTRFRSVRAGSAGCEQTPRPGCTAPHAVPHARVSTSTGQRHQTGIGVSSGVHLPIVGELEGHLHEGIWRHMATLDKALPRQAGGVVITYRRYTPKVSCVCCSREVTWGRRNSALLGTLGGYT
jgi:hypothetical protein